MALDMSKALQNMKTKIAGDGQSKSTTETGPVPGPTGGVMTAKGQTTANPVPGPTGGVMTANGQTMSLPVPMTGERGKAGKEKMTHTKSAGFDAGMVVVVEKLAAEDMEKIAFEVLELYGEKLAEEGVNPEVVLALEILDDNGIFVELPELAEKVAKAQSKIRILSEDEMTAGIKNRDSRETNARTEARSNRWGAKGALGGAAIGGLAGAVRGALRGPKGHRGSQALYDGVGGAYAGSLAGGIGGMLSGAYSAKNQAYRKGIKDHRESMKNKSKKD